MFETAPLAREPEWEIDAREQRLVASVVIGGGAPGVYDYLVPSQFCDLDRLELLLEPGRRVRVPFGRGNRSAEGYCVALETKSVDIRSVDVRNLSIDRFSRTMDCIKVTTDQL